MQHAARRLDRTCRSCTPPGSCQGRCAQAGAPSHQSCGCARRHQIRMLKWVWYTPITEKLPSFWGLSCSLRAVQELTSRPVAQGCGRRWWATMLRAFTNHAKPHERTPACRPNNEFTAAAQAVLVVARCCALRWRRPRCPGKTRGASGAQVTTESSWMPPYVARKKASTRGLLGSWTHSRAGLPDGCPHVLHHLSFSRLPGSDAAACPLGG